jgi:hypothetical protein
LGYVHKKTIAKNLQFITIYKNIVKFNSYPIETKLGGNAGLQ